MASRKDFRFSANFFVRALNGLPVEFLSPGSLSSVKDVLKELLTSKLKSFVKNERFCISTFNSAVLDNLNESGWSALIDADFNEEFGVSL
tara:strand:+ start:147 stop:416 length:270 start_codon:yes stop_codon:yes gene_type:complete